MLHRAFIIDLFHNIHEVEHDFDDEIFHLLDFLVDLDFAKLVDFFLKLVCIFEVPIVFYFKKPERIDENIFDFLLDGLDLSLP